MPDESGWLESFAVAESVAAAESMAVDESVTSAESAGREESAGSVASVPASPVRSGDVLSGRASTVSRSLPEASPVSGEPPVRPPREKSEHPGIATLASATTHALPFARRTGPIVARARLFSGSGPVEHEGRPPLPSPTYTSRSDVTAGSPASPRAPRSCERRCPGGPAVPPRGPPREEATRWRGQRRWRRSRACRRCGGIHDVPEPVGHREACGTDVDLAHADRHPPHAAEVEEREAREAVAERGPGLPGNDADGAHDQDVRRNA